MLAFSFFRCESLSPSLFSSVFSIPLKKKKKTFYSTNEPEINAYSFGYIQCYITNTFTKLKIIAIKFSMATVFLKLISVKFKMALQVPEHAHAKACSVPMKRKLHSALLHSRQTFFIVFSRSITIIF